MFQILYFDAPSQGRPSISHLPILEIDAPAEVGWALLDAAEGTRYASAAGLCALAVMMGLNARVWAGVSCSDAVAARSEHGAIFVEEGGKTLYRKTRKGVLLSQAQLQAEAEQARNSAAWADARNFLALAVKALNESRAVFEKEVRRAG